MDTTPHTYVVSIYNNTHLELQHVFAVIADLHAELVNVRGAGESTAPILPVSCDVKGHSRVRLVNYISAVAVVLRIETPWSA